MLLVGFRKEAIWRPRCPTPVPCTPDLQGPCGLFALYPASCHGTWGPAPLLDPHTLQDPSTPQELPGAAQQQEGGTGCARGSAWVRPQQQRRQAPSPSHHRRFESLRTPRSERSRINTASQAAQTHFSALSGLSAALQAHVDRSCGPSQNSAAALAEGAALSAGVLGCPHAFGGVAAQEAGAGGFRGRWVPSAAQPFPGADSPEPAGVAGRGHADFLLPVPGLRGTHRFCELQPTQVGTKLRWAPSDVGPGLPSRISGRAASPWGTTSRVACCEPVLRAGSRGSYHRAPTAATSVFRGKSLESWSQEQGLTRATPAQAARCQLEAREVETQGPSAPWSLEMDVGLTRGHLW